MNAGSRLRSMVQTQPGGRYCHEGELNRLDCVTNSINMIPTRSEEHTSELQSLMRISYAVFCLKKKTTISKSANHPNHNYTHQQLKNNESQYMYDKKTDNTPQ